MVDLPARPDQFIEFYLADPYSVVEETGAPQRLDEAMLVGPHGRPGTRLIMTGDVCAFSIRFLPGGLHRLAGLNMADVADRAIILTDVFGGKGTSLRDAVMQARDFEARVAAASQCLCTWASSVRGDDPVAAAARAQLASGGRIPIAALAAGTGLSERQFERRFVTQIGLSAKLYARTARLSHLFALRAAKPALRWVDLAYDAGFSDQSHLVRECRTLAGMPPGRLVDPLFAGARD